MSARYPFALFLEYSPLVVWSNRVRHGDGVTLQQWEWVQKSGFEQN